MLKPKQEEGVSISDELALLRQQVYELKTENQILKDCAKEDDYVKYQECVLK